MAPTTTAPVFRPTRMASEGPRSAQRRPVVRDGALDAERRVHGAARAVLVGDRRPEEGHDAVTRVLVDCSLEAMHLGRDALEAAVDDAVDLFGVELLGEAREPGYVREQHGHLAALALQCRPRVEDLVGQMLRRVDGALEHRRRGHLLQALAAVTAEAEVRRHLGAAVRAAGGQRGAAPAAEPHAGRALERALWTSRRGHARLYVEAAIADLLNISPDVGL